MPAPRVSVLVTTRNGAAWLRPTLDSVFAQTFTDFELIVVDDASTDDTPSILAGIADPRLRVLRHHAPLGIAAGRNLGFAACRAAHVAVLDHDDISLPGRLAAQLAHMDAHPRTVLLGTATAILRDGRVSSSGQPERLGPAGLRLLLHLGNPLTWSSVMVRSSALRAASRNDQVLDAAFEPADDFDLYHRMLALGDVARLDQVLTRYRWHAGNTTHRTAATIDCRAALVLSRAYHSLALPDPDRSAALAIRHLSNRETVPDEATLDRVLALIDRTALACGDPDDLARTMRWGVLRAAIRGGRPHFLFGRRNSTGHPVDVALGTAAGAARWAARAMRR